MKQLCALTENERAWVEFLRLLTLDNVPVPTLSAVQALRNELSGAVPLDRTHLRGNK